MNRTIGPFSARDNILNQGIGKIRGGKMELQKVLNLILDSIAKEEVALSQLMKAEAEKIQAFVGTNFNFPTCPSNEQILSFNESVSRLMENILMKEWLLLKKLEDTMKLINIPSCHHQCSCEYDIEGGEESEEEEE